MKTILGLLSFFGFLLICLDGVCQTASVPKQTIITTAPVVNAQTITITTAKNGGRVSFTIPAQTLSPLTATIPASSAPVSMSGFTGSFSCAMSSTGSFSTNPDGSITVTGLTCTITK